MTTPLTFVLAKACRPKDFLKSSLSCKNECDDLVTSGSTVRARNTIRPVPAERETVTLPESLQGLRLPLPELFRFQLL